MPGPGRHQLLEQVGLSPDVARSFAAALQDHHPAEVVGQYVTDVMFRRRIVDWLDLRGEAVAPTWAYDFAWRSAVSGLAEHCLDVPFIFDVLEDPDVTRVAGPEPPQALADQVHAAFVGFVRNQIQAGRPTGSQSRSWSLLPNQPPSIAATNPPAHSEVDLRQRRWGPRRRRRR